jgi:hypothetical protein
MAKQQAESKRKVLLYPGEDSYRTFCKLIALHPKSHNRIHSCLSCGYTTHRDVAASLVIRNRGINALGRSVEENACRDGLTETGNRLVKSRRSKNSGGEARIHPAS